ncbi:hypothetical protein GCM10010156_64490 [Planobispora rosea]|uniref:Uncharacterized protein n=1 Tax=Planobispora rosea TaxID=35762 RepID=A0A8J3WFZ3_PLARO|nr:hypothetical protein [Planobispora rosea]GGS97392.1 hypothetical protein GCM10010156_64490 [Planobispora rosea]GIH87873.1 hypothetical protein Pro02_62810 [Planobispora rosea]
MDNDETRTVRLTVEVQDCGIAHLLDKNPGGYGDTPAQSIGFIEVEQGCVNLHITHQWGPANFTVTVADQDPGAALAAYEDIMEIGFVSMSGEVEMTGFTFDEAVMCPVPCLPAGPGTYRIRYHVKGMDLEGAEDAGDDHYLQIWPAPLADPMVVKSTSVASEYFRDPEKYQRDHGL